MYNMKPIFLKKKKDFIHNLFDNFYFELQKSKIKT